MKETIASTTEALRAQLPDWLGWLATLAGRTLDYLAGPLVDNPGRFHWVGLVSALLLTALVWLGMRRRGETAGQGFLGFAFPRRIITHPSTWVDLKVGFFNAVVIGNALNLTWRFNTALIVAGITAALTALFGPGPQDAEWGLVAILVMALVLSMANDLGYFLFHWASHVWPPLWAIHKLHHSAEVLSPLTTARVHPLERAVLGPFRAVTVGLVMGPVLYFYAGEASVITVLGLELTAFAFRALGFVLHHSHVPLYFGPAVGRVIVSPLQHQVHHSSLPPHLDKNFAEFWAFWDWLFGTLYLPKRGEVLKFGLAGQAGQPHPTLTRAYLVPVWEAAAALAGIVFRRRRGPAPDQGVPQPPDPARP